MATLNPREEIVGLLRGYFACPVIVALGKQGVFERFLAGSFQATDIPKIVDIKLFQHVLKYFVSLGLLTEKSAGEQSIYAATELGNKVFQRYGSFVLLHSYRDLIEHMSVLLFEENATKPRCDRLDNVIGSGLTNGRKFFPKAIEMMETLNPTCIADIACGDGEFLRRVIQRFPAIDVIASDLSPIAIERTSDNLHKAYPNTKVHCIQSDALDTQKWVPVVDKHAKNLDGAPVISMWYLIHEISGKDETKIISFLREINRLCPSAHLIIGEIVSIPSPIMERNRHGSIMPEFMLFHDISGQGVLTWRQFQAILENVPYNLEHEARFDLVQGDGEELPTGIVWHLKPKA